MSNFRIVEGPYLRDILDQPRALSATLPRLEISPALVALAGRVWEKDLQRVVLTGMGASLHALYPLELQLAAAGMSVVTVETSELIHYLPGLIADDALLVAVSQSGESAEIVRLLELNGGRAALIGITNEAQSTLARRALASLVTHAGKEFSVSCKTYVSTLLALRLLGALLCAENLAQIMGRMETLTQAFTSYLDGWKDHAAEIGVELADARQVFLLGRGPSLAAARTGALTIKESVRFYSEGMSGAAFRHGPMEMLNREIFAVVYSGSETTRSLQQKLACEIQHAGGRVGWIAEETGAGPWKLPTVPEDLRHVVEILPVQMVTLGLAARQGMEAGRFAIATKVTTTE